MMTLKKNVYLSLSNHHLINEAEKNELIYVII